MSGSAHTILNCSNVSCAIGGVEIIRNCTFSLQPGELIALVGPNGSGKTTLLRAIAGMQSSSGEIYSEGKNCRTLSAKLRARLISYLPQNGQIFWPMRVDEIVSLGLLSGIDFNRSLPPRDRNFNQDDAVRFAMERCSVDHLAYRNAMSLSGGERARVLLARALVVSSRILLADEPIASLDPKYQLSMMQVLRAYADTGTAVLAVLHNISFALRFANRVILLNDGKIAGDGPGDQLLSMGLFDDVFGVRFEPMASPVDGIVSLKITGQ